MHTIIIGIALLFISFSSFSLVQDVIKEKDEVLWFRLIQLIFALLLGIVAVFMASFLR